MNASRFSQSSSPSCTWFRRAIVPLLAVVALGAAAGGNAMLEPTSSAATPVPAAVSPARLGVYDSRAVALAYGRSQARQRQFIELRAQHQKAVAAGDQELAAKLQKQGEALQIRMNLQVFSNAPADDAIEHVDDRLAEVAGQAGVCAIVPAADYRADSTEVVDVTEMMVRLFDPTPETLKMARQCREKDPAPIEQIAQVPAANKSR